jgi:ATP-dependent Clp protease protease subunit
MHQGSAGLGGTAADVEIYASQLERLGALMHRLTGEHSGQSAETIAADGLRDRWFTAAEAREYGLIDHILEHVDDVRPTSGKRRIGV